MNVVLSPTAGEQLHQIINYLEQRWSTKVRDNFIHKLERTMDAIALMPYAYPVSKKLPGIHKAVITPQTIAYYRIDKTRNEVEIIAVVDARQQFF